MRDVAADGYLHIDSRPLGKALARLFHLQHTRRTLYPSNQQDTSRIGPGRQERQIRRAFAAEGRTFASLCDLSHYRLAQFQPFRSWPTREDWRCIEVQQSAARVTKLNQLMLRHATSSMLSLWPCLRAIEDTQSVVSRQ